MRLDPLTGRWVAVGVERSSRPEAFSTPSLEPYSIKPEDCPFCPGNEESDPPALFEKREGESWSVRVVPNLYPAFSGDDPFVVTTLGPVFTEAPASGRHEVLVLSPSHYDDFANLSDNQIADVMEAVKGRLASHDTQQNLRYSQVIINQGREAGASMEHPHAQILGLPFVPRELADEQAGFARFAGGCLLCTTIGVEERSGFRIVYSDEEIFAICPYWSGTPYEILILPRKHEASMERSDLSTLVNSGLVLKRCLKLLNNAVGKHGYNVFFHFSPFRSTGIFHWHIHLLPKLVTTAGFELGAGVMVNIVAPELAAEELRKSANKIAGDNRHATKAG